MDPEQLKALTVENLDSGRPDLVKTLVKRGEDAAKAAIKPEDNTEAVNKAAEKASKEALEGERARCAGIMGKLTVQEYKGYSAIAQKAVKDGLSVEASEGLMKDQRIKDLQAGKPANAGPDSDAGQEAGDEGADLEGMEPEERAKAEYKRDSKLAKEFKSEKTYVAFRVKELKGQTKVFRKKQ